MTGSTRTTNTLDYNLIAASLTFDSAAGAFVIGGTNTLTLGAGGIGVASGNANPQTFNANLALGAAQSWTNNGSGLFTVGGAVANGGFLLTVDGTGDSLLSGVLSDAGGLTKAGGGILTLSGVNTFGGVVTVTGGTLRVGADSAFGAVPGAATPGKIVLDGGIVNVTTGFQLDTKRGVQLGASGGTVAVNSGQTLTYGGTVTGTGNPLFVTGAGNTTLTGAVNTGSGGRIEKTGTGTLTVSANSNYAAVDASSVVISVSGGGILSQPGEGTSTAGASTPTGVLPSAPVPSYVFLDSGTLRSTRVGIGVTFLATNKGITLGTGGGTLEVTDATTGNLNIYSGVITGPGGLTKGGGGVLSLTHDQTYSGETNIINGTLRLRAVVPGSGAVGTYLPDRTNLTVSSPGVFDLFTFNETIGSLAGNGSVVASSSVTSTLTIGGPVADTNNNSTTFSGNITSTAGANTSLSLAKRGTGTLTLSGNNLYTGTTNVSGGVIEVRSNSALGTAAGVTTVANGAAVQFGVTGLTLTEPFTLNGSGVAGGGALRNLTGSNTLSGTIALATSARINSDSGTLTIGSNITGTTQTLTIGGAGNTAVTGVVATTTGGLTKDGTGTLTLSGSNTFSGGTVVTSGSLIVSGQPADGSGTGSGPVTVNGGTFGGTGRAAGAVTVNTGGTLAPGGGNTGTLTVGAGGTLNTGAVFRVGIAPGAAAATAPSSGDSATRGVGNTFLDAAANAFAFNTPNVLVDVTGVTFAPSTLYSFQVAQASGVVAGVGPTPVPVGSFTFVDNGTDVTSQYTSGGPSLTYDPGTSTVYLNFSPVPEPGTLIGFAAGALAVGRLVRRRVIT